jgi:hypothetical protein
MKNLIITLIFFFAAIAPAGHEAQSRPAPVQPQLANSKVQVWAMNDGGYRRPISAGYAEVRERLKKRGVLETYSQFLAPLRLPYSLRIYASECDRRLSTTPYYSAEMHAINVCYQFLQAAENVADELVELQKKKPGLLPEPVTRDEFLTGMIVAVLMHETGHAIFDLLDVPIFGREEDAADQMAAFIALQFDKDVARTIIKGFAYYWAKQGELPGSAPKPGDFGLAAGSLVDPFPSFSDEHGTAGQRMYNTICGACRSMRG